MINDDLPPPLEDMSAFLAKRTAPITSVRSNTQSLSVSGVTVPKCKSDNKTAGFSGLKKGFFDSKPTIKVAEIPLLKPKNPSKNPLVIDQVQNALPSTDWITSDILEKIEKSPVLSKAFQDPMFTTAISEMTSNAPDALKKYQKERPDLILALEEFAKLMGNQVSNVAISQIPKDIPRHEQELLKNVIQNPNVQEALKDSKIQKILSSAAKDPLALSRALHDGSPDIKKKIQLLLQAGILSTSM